MENRAWLEVDLKQIKCNAARIKSETGKQLCAVIKADGYGVGALKVGMALCDIAVAFGVATVDEGIVLSKSFPQKDIFILGKSRGQEIKKAIAHNLIICVDSVQEATIVSDEAAKQVGVARVQIAVDSGMSRIGMQFGKDFYREADKIFELASIDVVGVFSHFADSETNKELSFNQESKFAKVKVGLECLGKRVKWWHICNSGGANNLYAHYCNVVRVGIALYEEAVSFCSRIIKVFSVQKGQGIGYGHTYYAKSDMRVGVVSCGYADGYPLAVSNNGFVEVGGQLARVVGRVCMDMFMIDVSRILPVTVGDKVVLWTFKKKSPIHVRIVAEKALSSEYELLTRVGNRVKRVYTT